MRNYYELDFDRYIQGIWYLDGPVDDDMRDDREFSYGKPLELRGTLKAPIHTPGKRLDFTLTLSQVPILSQRFVTAIRSLVRDHAQLFPVHIEGHEGFEVMNTTVLVPCIDDKRSEFIKWTDKDGRPDLIGHYRMVTRLLLDPIRIPENLHVFRPMFWEMPIIVSQAFVDAIRPLNAIGPKLKLVT
jgi:hypothetical protein